MKTNHCSVQSDANRWRHVLAVLALYLSATANAAELTGTVENVSGSSVKIALDGDLVPNANDKVEFFFKLPGTDDEISVGTGVVTEVEGKVVSTKFEIGSGKPQTGNLARIQSQNPQQPSAVKTAKPEPAPAAKKEPVKALPAEDKPASAKVDPPATPKGTPRKPASDPLEGMQGEAARILKNR